ncbi:vesicle-associated protein 3-1-like [Apium graveolens]|uniref:vesicle-associated protein 3-1-like n=1 Tax=Apium graveolens TaxID=4045 RepID=UPI003D78B5E7
MAYFGVLVADSAKDDKRNKNTQLLKIEPLDLKLNFESKKPSTFAINLINACDHNHVAFKVSTTAPEKYNVHPNTGLIKSNSKSNFTVTLLQDPSIDNLADIKCGDKFLIMSRSVPFLANQDDVTPALWTEEDSASYVEENSLSFVLAGKANSLPLNLAEEIELLEAILNNLQKEFSTAKEDQLDKWMLNVDDAWARCQFAKLQDYVDGSIG